MKNLYEFLTSGLARTHNQLMARIEGVFAPGASRENIAETIEEILITSDVGVKTSGLIADAIRHKVSHATLDELKAYLRQALFELLKNSERHVVVNAKPSVFMMLGVNGVGKTTTIGKLAARFTSEGKKVMLAAGDTFRAAAIEQLEVWAKRSGCDLIKQNQGGDPAAVAYDAVKAAVARKVDILILDTAGRLHTKTNLMEELKKIKRVIAREIAGAPHELFLVLDASTGQNAINQARMFHEAVGVTGIILAKLDGTAKGGVIAAIAHELKIPVCFVGVGEDVEDLREFKAKEFVEALI